MAGIILVNDVPVDKPGTQVSEEAQIRIRGKVMPYVGRGGYKLEKAIQEFHLELQGLVVADIGASTGGFTDCALQHGAAKVFAIDVGHNQLDWRLRNDSRVVNLEKTNIKGVTVETLGEQVDLIVTDISFISVLKIMPAARSILKKDGAMVILIKPQFEAGREQVGKGGVVRDPEIHQAVICDVVKKAAEEGFLTEQLTYSPIKGGTGNIEFLALLRWMPTPASAEPGPSGERIACLVREAHQILKG